jgi:two-component system, OmpR family, response regulator VanR
MNAKLILKNLNLLFVDDNPRISAEIYSIFSSIFNNITLAHNACTALSIFQEKPIDLIITDIEMPGEDGLTLIEKIRDADQEVPIIILSAHSDHQYLMRAANLRIDGYITKPISFHKLNTALAKTVQRLEHKVSAIKLSPQIVYHPLLKVLYVDGQEVSLGTKECLLLELLLYKHHRVVGRTEIADIVWPDHDMTESALKNLISELRKKLKYDLIKNQPSRGWILNTQDDDTPPE